MKNFENFKDTIEAYQKSKGTDNPRKLNSIKLHKGEHINSYEIIELKKIVKSSLVWRLIFGHLYVDEYLFDKYLDDEHIDYALSYKVFSLSFIENHIDKLDKAHVSKLQKLTFDMIKKYENELDFHLLSFNENIDILEFEKFVTEYKDNPNLDWIGISCMPNLSNEFIEKNKDKLYFSALIRRRNYRDNDFPIVFLNEISKLKEELQYENKSLKEKCYEDFVYEESFIHHKMTARSIQVSGLSQCFKDKYKNQLEKYNK